MTGKTLKLSALATTLIIITSAVPGLAWDGRGGDPGERGFIYLLKTSDANKDGRITEDEAMVFRDGRFEEIDVNVDGVITPSEFSDFRKARMETFMKDQPRRSDGKMATKAPGPDNRSAAKDRMTRADRTPDGTRRQMAMNEGGPRHHANKSGRMEHMFFVRADKDRSGQVSKDEFVTTGKQMFARMDSNGDMIITVDDLPARQMR